MALNWQWNDKMGTAKHVEGYTLNLYKETAELVQMFAKAKLEIKIELYKGEKA